MKLKYLLLIFLSVIAIQHLKAQGCSDAGFCSLGILKPNIPGVSEDHQSQFAVVLANGIGDEDVFVSTLSLQYGHRFNKNWNLEAKLTANYATGELGDVTNAGDLFISSNYNLTKKKRWNTSFLASFKIPLNMANAKSGQLPLPMQYQSSLGTFDAILGVSLTEKHWVLTAAWQQPLSGTNGNTFLPAYWTNGKADKYPPSNDFNRKADLLLRTGYKFRSGENWNFQLGLLGIYHLGKDSYIDGNISNKPIAIDGSEGLTLNGTASVWFKLNKRFTVGVTTGAPFVVRDVRPDGLTRKFVINPELNFSF